MNDQQTTPSMKHTSHLALTLAFVLASGASATLAEELTTDQQSRVEAQLKEIQVWASAPAIVSAVRAQNAGLPADYTSMNQDKWKGLTVLDPLVRNLTKTPAAEFLKTRKTDIVTEAFVSDANGNKVGFLSKTSSWNHKGKDKHDVPMTGKTWKGPVETDDSTGLRQVQVAVPVLDGDKPIGSLVVGLSLSRL
jgi:hypothetical protein